MPRRCSVCDHPPRAEIDEALVGASVSLRGIARQHGVDDTSVWRHSLTHIPALLAMAHEAEVVAEADTLMSRVHQRLERAEGVIARAEVLLSRAEGGEDLEIAIKALEAWRKSNADIDKALELLGRVTGELRDKQVNVNVLVASPEWVALRGRLLEALGPFPEARAAVVRALSEREAPRLGAAVVDVGGVDQEVSDG